MFKFVSTTIIAASMAICSFSVAAGSHVSEKDKETMRKESLSDPNAPENTSKKEGHKYDAKTSGPSEKERKTMHDETMGKKTMGKEMTGKKTTTREKQ
jgi:hypothetical protein